ncbi:MAG TPA: hypothetical protein VEP90_26195, partial [Methylomirabilota bacterium]|nr:hypothetical protein [Methylomirabilota bacterium]
LEVRRNKKLFEHQEKILNLQEKIYSTVQTRLDRIIKILDKPIWAIIWAGIGAVTIGVVINIITDLYQLLPIFHSAK